MDELTVNQTKYISSKRAAEVSGYAKDYIGQMVRLGKLDAKRVGRAWYVNEDQIKGLASPKAAPAVIEGQVKLTKLSDQIPARAKGSVIVPHTIQYSLPKTWSNIKYFNDDGPLHPISDKQDYKPAEITNKQSSKYQVLDSIDGIRVVVAKKVVVDAQKVTPIEAKVGSEIKVLSRVSLGKSNPEKKMKIAVLKSVVYGVLIGVGVLIILMPILL